MQTDDKHYGDNRVVEVMFDMQRSTKSLLSSAGVPPVCGLAWRLGITAISMSYSFLLTNLPTLWP